MTHNFLQSIFSITNTKNRRFKLLTICNVKFKLKRGKYQLRLYNVFCKKYEKTIIKLKNEKKVRKIRVAFYVNDTKWKCQNVYNLLLKSKYYSPFIIVGKSDVPESSIEYQSKDEIIDIFNSFKAKNMEVYLAYDFDKEIPVSLKSFQPDIIFYSRHWRLFRKHDVKSVVDFALPCYVPYFISNSPVKIEAGYDFHNTVWRYYVINEDLKDEYSEFMQNEGANLKAVGYPNLDGYLDKSSNEKQYIIYAPHWSVGGNTLLNYATFDWNGEYILNFAKQHSEFNWVFKPHPRLKKELVFKNIMSEQEVERYYDEWNKIGIKYEGPDYIDLFKQSRALITDCGSFLTEYMPSRNPVILLCSSVAKPYNFLAQKVTRYYYHVHNLGELSIFLDQVLLKKIDVNKEARLTMLNSLHLVCDASQNIINDLNKELEIEC